jgi:hypothetical protein
MTQRQKNNLRSADTVVHHAQKSFKHWSKHPRWWHLFCGTKTGYCWLTTLKRVQQSQPATTPFPCRSEAGTGLQTVDKLSKEVLILQDNACPHTAAITQLKLVDLLKHPVYSPDLAPCSPTLKNTWSQEIFETMRMPRLLQTTGLLANLQHSMWIV